ncbi:MAG: hypothetical protein ACRCZB_05185 [Bacteroidales bacterium]
MSTNSQDYGVQHLSFDYRAEARAQEFNKLFHKLLPYGVYAGGTLTRTSDVSIDVEPMTVVIESNNDDGVAVKIDTTESQIINFASSVAGDCDITKPYIILRFGWESVEDCFMEIINVSFEAILTTDIILGKVNFDSSTGINKVAFTNTFDYSRRQEVSFQVVEESKTLLSVQATEPVSNKVTITGGTLLTSKGKFEIVGASVPKKGVTPTKDLPRIDIVALDEFGVFVYKEGEPSVDPEPPLYGNLRVIAQIKIPPNSSLIRGDYISDLNDLSILQGVVTPEDTPIEDSEERFTDNDTITKALHFLWRHSLVLNRDSKEVEAYQLDAETSLEAPLGKLFI